MKILYSFPYDGIFMTKWQVEQIFDELHHSGVEIEIHNPLDYRTLEEYNIDLVQKLKTGRGIDMYLNCMGDEYFLDDTINELKHIPLPKVLVCWDNLHAPYMHKKSAPHYDLVWLTSWETEPMFRKWGCNTIFLPYAASPYLYADRYSHHIERVCFVGTPYGSRTRFINEITESGTGFDVFHSAGGKESNAAVGQFTVPQKSKMTIMKEHLSFPIGRKVLCGKIMSAVQKGQDLKMGTPYLHVMDSLSFEEMNATYSNYALSLNVTALRNTYHLKHPVQKLHLRTFEIPMSAGLEFVPYNEELAGYFSEEEMVFFHDKEEMVDKARFYCSSKRSELCRRMKQKARKRAEEEHTWTKRFQRIFEKIKIKHRYK